VACVPSSISCRTSTNVIAALLFAPAAAMAASQPSPTVRRACIADAKKFCGSVLFQPEKRREGMKEHRPRGAGRLLWNNECGACSNLEENESDLYIDCSWVDL
jgi:hypothetical protein